MKLRAFSCNGVILRKNLRRYRPAMLIVGILMLLRIVLPLFSVMDIFRRDDADILSEVASTSYPYALTYSLIYAAVAAGCTFGYLHNQKSSFMIHAFPITRDCLFATNYVSGLLLFLIPFVPNALLVFLMPALYGYVLPKLLLISLLNILQYVFFYSLAVFCMHLSGKRSFAIFCYFVLNFIALFTVGFMSTMLEPYLVGLEGVDLEIGAMLSPFAYLIFGGLDEMINTDYALQWGYTLVLFAVAIGLTVCALLLYRRRPIESVGQSMCYKKTAVVCHVILTLMIAVFFGLILYATLPVQDQTVKLACVVLAGYVGYMLLNKPLHRKKMFTCKSLLHYALIALVIVAVDLFFRFDVLNIVGYVPEVNEIQSITINDENDLRKVTLTDPKLIEEFCDLHTKIIEDYDLDEEDVIYYLGSMLEIEYKLNNGDTVNRYYRLTDMAPSQMEIYDQALQFFTSYEFNELYLNELRQRIGTAMINDNNQALSQEQIDKLFEALKKDALSTQNFYLWSEETESYVVVLGYITPDGHGSWYMDIPATATNATAYLDSIYNSNILK